MKILFLFLILFLSAPILLKVMSALINKHYNRKKTGKYKELVNRVEKEFGDWLLNAGIDKNEFLLLVESKREQKFREFLREQDEEKSEKFNSYDLPTFKIKLSTYMMNRIKRIYGSAIKR